MYTKYHAALHGIFVCIARVLTFVISYSNIFILKSFHKGMLFFVSNFYAIIN